MFFLRGLDDFHFISVSFLLSLGSSGLSDSLFESWTFFDSMLTGCTSAPQGSSFSVGTSTDDDPVFFISAMDRTLVFNFVSGSLVVS